MDEESMAEREWIIALPVKDRGFWYAVKDGAGYWSLWDNRERATGWPSEAAAEAALARGPAQLRFGGAVVPKSLL